MKLYVLLLLAWNGVAGEQLTIQIPNIKPERDNVYICTGKHLNEHPRYYITGIHPTKVGSIHHFGVFFCKDLASKDQVWDCAYMNRNHQMGLNHYDKCAKVMDMNLLYTWSYNTTSLFLPEDASYEVGYETHNRYVVLEVHYAHADAYKDGETDDTMVTLDYTTKRTQKKGGFLITSPFSGHPMTPGEETVIEVATPVDSVFHPTFYQVHTHELGTMVTGWLVKRKNGIDKWTLLGKRHPIEKPQIYVPVENKVTAEPGDYIAHRCTFYNSRDTVAVIGVLGENEMCNFYMMYWSSWDQGNHPDNYLAPVMKSGSWSRFKLKNTPPRD